MWLGRQGCDHNHFAHDPTVSDIKSTLTQAIGAGGTLFAHFTAYSPIDKASAIAIRLELEVFSSSFYRDVKIFF